MTRRVLQSKSIPTRLNSATAWLGTLDQRLGGGVVRKVLYEAIKYSDERAKNGVPWDNGPLFLPQYRWTQEEALDMTRQLVCCFTISAFCRSM